MATFSQRLSKAKNSAGLTIEELACWFGDISKQAVWMWCAARSSPQKYREAQAERALAFLEQELKRNKPRLPIPMSVRLGDRQAYVRSIRASYDS